MWCYIKIAFVFYKGVTLQRTKEKKSSLYNNCGRLYLNMLQKISKVKVKYVSIIIYKLIFLCMVNINLLLHKRENTTKSKIFMLI